MSARLLSFPCILALLFGGLANVNAASAPDLATAYNGFGFRLFDRLSQEASNQNVFLSPTSVAVALAIVANGAAGKTREDLLQTLGAPGVSIAGFNESNKALTAALSDPGNDVRFSIANAIWANPRFSLLPAFVGTSGGVYRATAQTLPFGDPSAVKTINAWVDKNTNGRIPEIVDSTSPDDVVIVTNAIAMKAKWQAEFEKDATHDAPFTTATGGHVTVSMMQREGTYAYAQSADWQVARLPYRGNRFAAYVCLPRKGLALQDALKSFDATAFDRAISGLHEQDIVFGMPRFTATYRAELNVPLAHLGMARAFEPGVADFSDMLTQRKAYISQVVHRAFVRVDEEGTEAAAATAVAIRALAMRAPAQTRMIVDRPFLMANRDDRTKQILFLGAIYKP